SETGTITVTTASAEARTAYLEAFDQVFAGHADLARAAARRALALDPNLLLAQALLNAIVPGVESMKSVDAAAAAGASLPEAERTELQVWAAAMHADIGMARALWLQPPDAAPIV